MYYYYLINLIFFIKLLYVASIVSNLIVKNSENDKLKLLIFDIKNILHKSFILLTSIFIFLLFAPWNNKIHPIILNVKTKIILFIYSFLVFFKTI